VKLAYLELFDQNARIAGACAVTYPGAGSTDGHKGARRDPYPGSFNAAQTSLQTAKTTRPGRGPTAVAVGLRMALCACPSPSDCFRRA